MNDGLDDMMHDKTNRDYISGSEKTNKDLDDALFWEGYYDGSIDKDYDGGKDTTGGGKGSTDGGKDTTDGGKGITDGGKGSTDGGKGCDGGKGNDDGSKSDTDSDDEDGSMSDDSPSSVDGPELISVTASPPPAGSTSD